jgi:hypothetical protein
VTGRATTIYVGNYGGNTVAEFPATGTGNLVPTRSIASDTSGLAPYLLTVDSTGQVWSPNFLQTASVTAFAPGASGLSNPTINLNGGLTGFRSPTGVAVSNAGVVYVTDAEASSVFIFPPGATGDTAPGSVIAGSNTGLIQPAGIALDHSNRIFVADFSASSVDEFAPGASGNVAPASTPIAGSSTGLFSPLGIAVDKNEYVYVANPGEANVLVYTANSAGNSPPTRTIGGSNTGLVFPSGVAVDGAGYIYVSDTNAGSGGSVFVFAPNATGNVAPLQTITGTNTTLTQPRGIAVF